MGDRRKFIGREDIIKVNTKKYIKKNVFLANNKICQNCTHFNRYQIKTEVFAVVRLLTLLLTVRLIFSREGGAIVPSCPPLDIHGHKYLIYIYIYIYIYNMSKLNYFQLLRQTHT
jgi:hypothetical protein